MFKDKYQSMFSRQMKPIVLLSFKYFSQPVYFLKLGTMTRIFPSFSWEVFSYVAC